MTEQFENAREKIIHNLNESNKIGTLGEKTLHAVLKHTFEPDENSHEIKVGGFYADIVNENGIFEIQTRNFYAMRKKLLYFLEACVVTIVYPVAETKWLVWIEPETGEIRSKRKSPKTGRGYEIFDELYRIKDMLLHPNLRFSIVFLDMVEYRILNGWSRDKKRGSTRENRVPKILNSILEINCTEDYKKLIPKNLPVPFSVKDLKKESRLHIKQAQTAVNVLKTIGVIKQVGKQGNAFLYEIV